MGVRPRHPLKSQVDNGAIKKETAIQLAGLGGGLSAIFTGNAVGLSDSKVADNIFSGQRIAGNAARNNALLIAGKYKVPFTESIKTKDGKDYDFNIGAQTTLGHVTGSFGTNGFSTTAEVNPSYGIAFYGSILPHGEKEAATVSYGYRSGNSLGIITTNNGNHGFYASIGRALSLYPVKYNVSIPIPINSKNDKN